jgi:type I restriction enzyme S subunit
MSTSINPAHAISRFGSTSSCRKEEALEVNVPAGWQRTSLGDILSLKNGFAFSSDFFCDSGPILLTPGNFRLDGGLHFDDRNTKRYRGPYDPKMTFEQGDLLIVMTDLTPDCNLLGRPAVVHSDELILHNQRIGKVILRDRSTDRKFLFYLLLSRPYLDHVKEMATGSTVRHTSNKTIYGIPVLLPSPVEQRAIAAALSDVDRLINALDKIIAKNRTIKLAAMQQLLTGKTRLTGFTAKWRHTKLGQLGTTYGGLTGKNKADFGSGTARYIPFLNIMNNVVIDASYLGSVRVSESESQNAAKVGDLFFNGSSETPEEVGMCAVLLQEIHDVYLNSFCFGFRLNNGSDENGLYLAYFFRSGEGRQLLYSLAQGATRYNLSKTSLLKLEFRIPPPEEQTAIATVLSDIDAEIAALEQRRDKTKAIKQGMAQVLLTGRSRLVKPEVVPA